MVSLTTICDNIVAWLSQPVPRQTPRDPDLSPETWETFRLVSRVHGVAPLLHDRLRRARWLDESTKSWLVMQYDFNTRRLARMHSELAEILALFNRYELPLMPLKGSVLSLQYYPEPGLRPMADLDLLIQPGDLNRAATLLAHLGYEPAVTHWKHTAFIKPNNRQVLAWDCEHPDNPRGLEIHSYCRETFGGPTVDLTSLMWDEATLTVLLGEPTLIPSPETLWLHLVVHATYHIWQGKGRLIHLVDLAQLSTQFFDPNNGSASRSNQPTGQDLLSLLNKVDARFTYPALALLKKYFPQALDDRLLTSQEVRLSSTFREWAASRDLVNSSYLNSNPPGPYLFKALKFTEGRPVEVAQALRFAFLPTLTEISLDHPRLTRSGLPWLAYFLLPLDWFKRFGHKTAD